MTEQTDIFREASLAASSRGRIRVHLPHLYRAPQVKAEVEARLRGHPGVTSVIANPLTARVLVEFDPGVTPDGPLEVLGLARGATRAPAPDARRPAGAGPKSPYPPWHERDAESALAFHGSSRHTGLTGAEAAQRLRHGRNALTAARPISPAELLLSQFKSPPVALLALSALISAATGGLAEAAAIAVVLMLNAGIGFVTERRADATIASLSELIDDVVPVLRDGAVRRIDSTQVVPGDIVLLAPGVRIAADLRLLEAHGLAIDESALTGESAPVDKEPAILPRAVPLAERRNMAYRGTAVAAGTGLGLAVGTGHRTEAGMVQALATTTQQRKTPAQDALEHLENQLVKVSSGICLAVFAIGMLRGYNVVQMFKTSISLAIAAVPEGLPTVATASMARGIRRMRKSKVLIRRLHAVEAIGAIDTICLDKTGTLTMNHMAAVTVQTVRHVLRPASDGATWRTRDQSEAAQVELWRLLQVCVLCNETDADPATAGAGAIGSATENALVELAREAGVAPDEMRHCHALLSSELRAEGRNYMRTVHTASDPARRLVTVKGSPGEVLALCASHVDGNATPQLDSHTRRAILRQNHDMARQQLRVLGFAYAEVAAGDGAAVAGAPLTWIGLVGMTDPLRPGVEDVIARFHEAGIRTVMLTGDQAATASVIGKALHLNDGDALHVINSDRLERDDGASLAELADYVHVFSRVSPARKLQIVRALQQGGNTIAMTGDGINDGPALRAADIGIAMGGGAELALAVADVALKDDRLEALLEAVRLGRTISTNIRKSLHFLVSSNLSEILVVLGSVLLHRGQPLSPLQLLWLNLLSDLMPAIALASEPAEDDVMTQAPRHPNGRIVEMDELWRYAGEGGRLASGALAAYVYGLVRHGDGTRAGTIAFDSLVLGQLLHALSCRSDRHRAFEAGVRQNRQMSLAIGGSVAMHVLAHLVPGLRRLLGLAPLGVMDLAATVAGAGLPLLLNEGAKARRMESGASPRFPPRGVTGPAPEFHAS